MYDHKTVDDVAALYDESCNFSLAIPNEQKDHLMSYDILVSKPNQSDDESDDESSSGYEPCTKAGLVMTLNRLPSCYHVVKSLKFMITVNDPSLIAFTVTGVFYEGEDVNLRAFTRNFVCTVTTSQSLMITNDQLFVRLASPAEVQTMTTDGSDILDVLQSLSSLKLQPKAP